MQDYWRSEAISSLETLRRGSTNYDFFLAFLALELKKGNLTLGDIGTSEEELEKLRVLGCKAAATVWLGFLRKYDVDRNQCMSMLNNELNVGSLTPEDIGATEKELAQFKKFI